MHLFKTKIPKIEFWHPLIAVMETSPIIPAHKFPMKWRKKAAENIKNTAIKEGRSPEATAKSYLCSGIGGLLSNSFVICAPMDYEITTNGDLHSFEWKVPRAIPPKVSLEEEPVNCFPPESWGEYVNLPKDTLKTIIKFNTYWGVSLPQGWGLMVSPSAYFEENRFTAASGMVLPNQTCAINIPVLWHVVEGKTIIKAGTPLALLTLIKLDKPDYLIRLRTTEDVEKITQTLWANLIGFKRPFHHIQEKVGMAFKKYYKEN